jgi:hypothetical protein
VALGNRKELEKARGITSPAENGMFTLICRGNRRCFASEEQQNRKSVDQEYRGSAGAVAESGDGAGA